MQTTLGLWAAQAVATAARLGIADALAQSQPQGSTTLARAVGADAAALARLLRALASLGVRGVILVDGHAERLRHDGLARAHPLREPAPRLPVRGIGLGDQPVAHGTRDIAAEQFADGSERVLLWERFCQHPEAGQGAE